MKKILILTIAATMMMSTAAFAASHKGKMDPKAKCEAKAAKKKVAAADMDAFMKQCMEKKAAKKADKKAKQ